MTLEYQLTEEDLDADGQTVVATLSRTSSTTATISWTLPEASPEYDGSIVTISTSQITRAELPLDGIRYTASANISLPADSIGTAQVVAALYGDKITKSINIINLDADTIYFASVHMVTNTLQYFRAGRQTYPIEQSTDTFSGGIPERSTPPLSPTLGIVYYNNQTGAVSMWSGATWVPAGVGVTLVGSSNPTGAEVGQFFYNSVTRKLYVWNGTSFTQANTEDEGIPMYDRLPGNDKSKDERETLIRIVKAQLGYPTICVELKPDHFEIAMDNAIQEFRRRCDNAYTKKYYVLPFQRAQDLYYLNDPVVGTSRVVDIIKIHRLSGLASLAQGDSGVYNQSFLNQLFAPGVVDLTSIHLLASYAEQFSQIFAGEIAFSWDEASRELHLFRRLNGNEKVVVECVAERTEQEIFVDRYAQQWIQGWAVSEAKMILGHIRSKYGNLPGAGGGITLNGDAMLASAEADQTELLRQIMDMEVGNGGATFGNYSFCIG